MEEVDKTITTDEDKIKKINEYISFLFGIMSGSEVTVFTAVNAMINLVIHLVNEHKMSEKEELLNSIEAMWEEYEKRKISVKEEKKVI